MNPGELAPIKLLILWFKVELEMPELGRVPPLV
jgi:hypothetical protein